MTYEEYTENLLKRRHKGPLKINKSWGVYDAFKHIRKNKWYNIGRTVTEKDYYYIIRNVNRLLAEELANGNTVIFPCRMGKLEVRKYAPSAKMVNGKLKINYPVDWGKTLKLWYEDEEEKEKKTLIRRELPYVYFIKYDCYRANYSNKNFYDFAVNRFLKLALNENVRKGKIETLW